MDGRTGSRGPCRMCKRGICSGWLYVLCSAKHCRRSHTVSLETGMIIIWAGEWLVPSVRRVVNHARIPAGGLHTGQIRHGHRGRRPHGTG